MSNHLRALRWFVWAIFGFLLPLGACAQQPNILFIFADDQCFDTLRQWGNEEIETPNLDRLARRGLTFRRTYNMGSWSGAVCIASRTMLNTGRFVWFAQAVHGQLGQERAEGRFWSEYLRAAGYETYFSGKWHVGENSIAEAAFDHARHIRPGMPNQTEEGYNRPIERQPDKWSPFDPSFGGYWSGGKHWSEVLGDDAVDFLRQAAQRDKPFFMYLAFNAPHDPRQSPREFVNKYPLEQISVPANFLPEYPYKDAIGCGVDLRDERLAPFPRTEYAVQVHRQEYYAIITHMDQQVGRILDALQQTGKQDETYIFFTADHGLAMGQHGLLGKQNMYDHSVRVPLIVAGPNVKPGTTNETPIYLQDVMPTTLELAGVHKPDHVQFHSLLPLIRGERRPPYEAIYGAYLMKQRAITMEGFKLMAYPDAHKLRLYDLDNDPLEMQDLADDPANQGRKQQLFRRLLELQRETGDELDLKSTFTALLD